MSCRPDSSWSPVVRVWGVCHVSDLDPLPSGWPPVPVPVHLFLPCLRVRRWKDRSRGSPNTVLHFFVLRRVVSQGCPDWSGVGVVDGDPLRHVSSRGTPTSRLLLTLGSRPVSRVLSVSHVPVPEVTSGTTFLPIPHLRVRDPLRDSHRRPGGYHLSCLGRDPNKECGSLQSRTRPVATRFTHDGPHRGRTVPLGPSRVKT